MGRLTGEPTIYELVFYTRPTLIELAKLFYQQRRRQAETDI